MASHWELPIVLSAATEAHPNAVAGRPFQPGGLGEAARAVLCLVYLLWEGEGGNEPKEETAPHTGAEEKIWKTNTGKQNKTYTVLYRKNTI